MRERRRPEKKGAPTVAQPHAGADGGGGGVEPGVRYPSCSLGRGEDAVWGSRGDMARAASRSEPAEWRSEAPLTWETGPF
jgi:hypothetical protein